MEFTGENFITVDRKAEKKAEVEDTTLRFRTTAISGLLFLAKSQRSLDTLELSLVGGQVRIFIRLGHNEKQMTIGQSLNDDFWHTITFKRRGNIIEAFIDDEEPKKGNTLLALTKPSLSQPQLNLNHDCGWVLDMKITFHVPHPPHQKYIAMTITTL